MVLRKIPERLLLVAIVAILGAGCAAPGGVPSARDDGRVEADDSEPPAPPARPARVEVEGEAGFTVTEVVDLPARARADYREAMRLLEEGNADGAVPLLARVVEGARDATAPHVDLGIAYAQTGAFDKAEDSLRAALAVTPDHPVALNELGVVYRKQGRFAEARQSYQRALAVTPGFHFARRNLAVLCDLYLADYACALEHYGVYQQTVANDREVDMWVRDLQSRVATGGSVE